MQLPVSSDRSFEQAMGFLELIGREPAFDEGAIYAVDCRPGQ